MKDIAKAYKAELEYLHRKIDLQDNTANIYEYLAEGGYDNIEEYKNDIQEYCIISQNYIVIEEPYIDLSLAIPYINSATPALLYAINCVIVTISLCFHQEDFPASLFLNQVEVLPRLRLYCHIF